MISQSIRFAGLLAVGVAASIGSWACSAGKSPTSTDAAADRGGEVGGDRSAPETSTDVDAMAGDVVSSAPVPCVDGGSGVVLATTTAPATPANLTSDGTNIYFTTQTNGGETSGLERRTG